MLTPARLCFIISASFFIQWGISLGLSPEQNKIQGIYFIVACLILTVGIITLFLPTSWDEIKSTSYSTKDNINKFSGMAYQNFLGGRSLKHGMNMVGGLNNNLAEKKPVVGYKRLVLIVSNNDNTAYFTPIHHNTETQLGIVSEAICREKVSRIHKHAVPHPKCTCGFYSFKDLRRAKLYPSKARWGTPIIVGLVNSGKFLEFEFGWRSQIQRITEIHVPKTCEGCWGDFPVVFYQRNSKYQINSKVSALCYTCASKHKLTDGRFIAFDELPKMLVKGVDDFKHALPVIVYSPHITPLNKVTINEWKMRKQQQQELALRKMRKEEQLDKQNPNRVRLRLKQRELDKAKQIFADAKNQFKEATDRFLKIESNLKRTQAEYDELKKLVPNANSNNYSTSTISFKEHKETLDREKLIADLLADLDELNDGS